MVRAQCVAAYYFAMCYMAAAAVCVYHFVASKLLLLLLFEVQLKSWAQNWAPHRWCTNLMSHTHWFSHLRTQREKKLTHLSKKMICLKRGEGWQTSEKKKKKKKNENKNKSTNWRHALCYFKSHDQWHHQASERLQRLKRRTNKVCASCWI